MNKIAKKKWVDALRSGRYKQGKQTLKSSNGYCCLGVLCVTQGLKFKTDANDDVCLHNYPDTYVNLPRVIRQSLGLSSRHQLRLIEMNDDEGKTFKEIASWIERFL